MSEKIKKLCTPQTLVCGLVLLFFGIVAFMFPYTGDDWAWGSWMGIERLETFFADYNGRYFGNFLVLAITRSEILKVVLMAVSYFFSCWLCYKYSDSKKTSVLLFSVFVFLLMGKAVFAQSVVWSSGYSNYVPSAIISVGYLTIVKNITKQDVPQYPKLMVIATVLMGFSGALFMENITLFNICLGVAVIGYSLIKFKKVYLAHIGFLVGAIAGAVWMFSNSVYKAVATGEDLYRTTASGLDGFLNQAGKNLIIICKCLFADNMGICIVTTVLLTVLVVTFNKTNINKPKKVVSICLLVVNILFVVVAIFKKAVQIFGFIDIKSLGFLNYNGFTNASTLVFLLTTLIIILLCVKKYRRFAMLLPFYCIPVAIAPLLVVTPIGPRCFFVSYLFMMVFLAELLSYIAENVKASAKKVFCGCVSAAVLAQMIFFISIFVPVHKYDVKRNELAKMQSDNNEEAIIVCDLPDKGYVWCDLLEKEPWPWRYKLFHQLNEDIPVTTVTAEEFDKIYDEYISEHK